MGRVVSQKYSRSTVSAGQIKVLELVYRYRFVSRYLVADSLGVKPENGLYEKLEVLVKYGCLAKRFEKRLKLQGMPATYYVKPKGLKVLADVPNHEHITDAVIKASYKDKSVGQDFITHTLNVYKYTNLLKRQHPALKVFTKRDISQYDYFPSQLPDAFLSLPTDNLEQPKRFFFDVIPNNQPRIALDRRIANYCVFFDEGGWEVTGSELPVLLLLCENKLQEKRAQRWVSIQMNRLDTGELEMYATTMEKLEDIVNGKDVWTNIENTEESLGLEDL